MFLVVVVGDSDAQIHVEVHGRQAFSPLEKNAHIVAFDRKAGALQRAAGIVHGSGAVAHRHGHSVERGVDIDGAGGRLLCFPAPAHRLSVNVIDGDGHVVTLLLAVES